MSFKMPSTEQVRELGDSLGIDVTDRYADSFIDFIKSFADGYRLIASLADDVPEIKYPRGGYYRPEGEENRHGAWIVKAQIKGASNGKLSGKIMMTQTDEKEKGKDLNTLIDDCFAETSYSHLNTPFMKRVFLFIICRDPRIELIMPKE